MHPVFAAAPAAAVAVAQSGVASQQAAVPLGIEMFVVVVSSVTGVLSARQHKLDFVGALWLAVLVGLGGGLLRDIILQVGDVYILNQPLALPTATITFVFPMIVERQDRIIDILDIFAVGLYSAVGADKAMVYGFEPTVCVMMGFFTAVGGGLLRDICLAQTPSIFKRGNFYAIAAIAGSTAYIFLVQGCSVNNIAALTFSTALTMFVRWLSLRYNIQSPTEVDLTRVVPRRHRTADVASARREVTARSADALADRRERTLADIQERREQERRKEALSRLKRMRRKRGQRKLDV